MTEKKRALRRRDGPRAPYGVTMITTVGWICSSAGSSISISQRTGSAASNKRGSVITVARGCTRPPTAGYSTTTEMVRLPMSAVKPAWVSYWEKPEELSPRMSTTTAGWICLLPMTQWPIFNISGKLGVSGTSCWRGRSRLHNDRQLMGRNRDPNR